MKKESINSTENSLLGQEVAYPTQYDPHLLFAIARQPNRATLHLPTQWYGADIWYAYEVSWLNKKGKPIAAIGRFSMPWDSPQLIESKSFKLYLNSFNQSQFDNVDAVKQVMRHDLSQAAGAPVTVELYDLAGHDITHAPTVAPLTGQLIDELDIEIPEEGYQPQPAVLRCTSSDHTVSETLLSNLLKSNCPVTGQPDWATVEIRYTGQPICKESLLRYVISFRQHTGFHEHCVESMYSDIMQRCQPTALFVMARYTRRGGLDINPWRSSHAIDKPTATRTIRQ